MPPITLSYLLLFLFLSHQIFLLLLSFIYLCLASFNVLPAARL